MIDEHKDKMPTGLVLQLLNACKEEAEATPYKLTWTMVDSHAHVVEDVPDRACVNLSHKTQTLIVEVVDELPEHPNGIQMMAMELPNHGMVLRDWVNHFTKQPSIPLVAYGRTDEYMVIVNSIVPYELKKRAREE